MIWKLFTGDLFRDKINKICENTFDKKRKRFMSVHCVLSTLMGKNRFTIQDVHQRTGLSRNTISGLYNDRVTRIDYDTVEKLCVLFGCTFDDLFEIIIDENII